VKIVAVMESSPTDGGAFHQAMNAVLQMQRLCQGHYTFTVATADPTTLAPLASHGIDAFHLPTLLFERLQPVLPPSRVIRRVLRAIRDPVDLERRLVAAGADLVYFVTHWGRAHKIKRLCYWATVWDLAHLDHSEFPEMGHEFRERERVLSHALGPALTVIADSALLAQRICHHYGVAPERVLVMPFAPALNLDPAHSRPGEEVLRRFGLEPGYFFYPAQFWAHKNHVRILQALRLCAERGQQLQVVFAGGNMGARPHVEATVHAMGLQSQVKFLGFVDALDMRGLYQGSRALVMPTYLGPTNLPPLEAWSLGVPVIYSRHLSEQAGDAALLANSDDATELAECMLAMLDDQLRADLVTRGTRRLQDIELQRREAEHAMLDRLQRLQARLGCWTTRAG
jgi:glycosyltransferase involved in cell wall biosynthesis